MALDHLAVEFLVRVQVVVVVVEAGILQLFGLAVLEHAQGDAGLQTQGLDGGNHFGDLVQVLVLRTAPGGAHAEAGCAPVLGGLGGLEHVIQGQQGFPLHVGAVAGGLGTVAAVLGTAAGLHGEQGGTLDRIGVEVFPVHLLGAEDQVHERQIEQGLHLLQAPHRLVGGSMGGSTIGGGRSGGNGGCDCIHGKTFAKNPTGIHTIKYGS